MLSLGKDIDIPSIQDFSWDETLALANESALLLLGVLKRGCDFKTQCGILNTRK